MKTTTPVQIKDKFFTSVNRARLHYTAILYKYDQGQKLSSEDSNEIAALTSAAPPDSGIVHPDQVAVVKGRFRRPCFELTMPYKDEPRKISMMKSIKQHVEINLSRRSQE